ncbi:MAG: hypothetical protein KatS3mg023_3647 [Armatimonadota bacterium]|nr:MAG: hypothetical protein KatS3mg023_3647 [Armatimonadota bacterium]
MYQDFATLIDLYRPFTSNRGMEYGYRTDVLKDYWLSRKGYCLTSVHPVELLPEGELFQFDRTVDLKPYRQRGVLFSMHMAYYLPAFLYMNPAPKREPREFVADWLSFQLPECKFYHLAAHGFADQNSGPEFIAEGNQAYKILKQTTIPPSTVLDYMWGKHITDDMFLRRKFGEHRYIAFTVDDRIYLSRTAKFMRSYELIDTIPVLVAINGITPLSPEESLFIVCLFAPMADMNARRIHSSVRNRFGSMITMLLLTFMQDDERELLVSLLRSMPDIDNAGLDVCRHGPAVHMTTYRSDIKIGHKRIFDAWMVARSQIGRKVFSYDRIPDWLRGDIP